MLRRKWNISLQGALATGSLCAITFGLYLERPSLALIIPGSVIFACLAWSYNRRGKTNA